MLLVVGFECFGWFFEASGRHFGVVAVDFGQGVVLLEVGLERFGARLGKNFSHTPPTPKLIGMEVSQASRLVCVCLGVGGWVPTTIGAVWRVRPTTRKPHTHIVRRGQLGVDLSVRRARSERF